MGASVIELMRSTGVDPIESRALMRTVLAVTDAQLAANPEQEVPDDLRQRYLALACRRVAGEPVAYLTGEREFYSLAFRVTPAVLIPRPETELLVDLALERARPAPEVRVLDLGTGSGCIAIAIAKHCRHACVSAADVSGAAIAIARENAARHGVTVEFHTGDWFDALPAGRYDLIVANPPYIAASDPHLLQADIRFEPANALIAGPGGFECLDTIVEGARRRLASGGSLLFEHGYDQAQGARERLAAAGYTEIFTMRDLAGHERVSGGRV